MSEHTLYRMTDDEYAKCLMSPKVSIMETTNSVKINVECSRARASELKLEEQNTKYKKALEAIKWLSHHCTLETAMEIAAEALND